MPLPSRNALFLGTSDDKVYLPYLKSLFSGVPTYHLIEPISLLTHLEMICARKDIDRVVTTSQPLLRKLLESKHGLDHGKAPSISNYAGSVFEHAGIEILIIDPLKQLFTVPYGRFVAQRYISKLVSPRQWTSPTAFSWSVLNASNLDEFYSKLSGCIAIAVDIETLKKNLAIRCIGYTGLYVGTNGKLASISGVLPLTDEFALAWMRRINALPVPKIFQNGKYDCSYLLRYDAAPEAWFWDTAHMFHSYYSELPKDLAFLNAFFLRKVVYWKDLAETNDLHEYYKYNALDTWATANVWASMMLELPEWAVHNYTLEFPLVFPCLLAEMTGIERDTQALQTARKEIDTKEEKELTSLRKMVGAPTFNPGSHVQVKTLLKVLGCEDLDSSDEKSLQKASYRHPLNGRILSSILEIRGLRKLRSTYLRTDSDAKQSGIHAGEGGAKEFCGRILYALNPHGTDTGRLASKEHHFWCGLQIQNIPRGFEVKQTVRASRDFFLGECDLEQAESRDTANIAGDENLIAAVSGTKDFHSTNASAFFGTPYEEIYDDAIGKTRNKKLRDLAKRVNHGANYNMGPEVLVDTMGLASIWDAKKLLNLPFTEPLEIAEYLLCIFHKTYAKLRGQTKIRSPKVLAYLGLKKNSDFKLFAPGTYYAWVAENVLTSNRLTSRVYHHTPYNLAHSSADSYISRGDWTRYCFGSPDKNKLDLNSYVAHCPQSLNARTLNEAFLRVFYEVALPNPETFRLHAQIHDSILFSYAPGYECHAERVRELMEIPVTIRDVSGITRTFTVPAALKLGVGDKRAVYWSETE